MEAQLLEQQEVVEATDRVVAVELLVLQPHQLHPETHKTEEKAVHF
jgi:hypothetical protein